MSICVGIQSIEKPPMKAINLDFLAGISPRNLQIAFDYIKAYHDGTNFIKRAGEVPNEWFQEVFFEIRDMAYSLGRAWFRIEDRIAFQFEDEDEDDEENGWLNGEDESDD